MFDYIKGLLTEIMTTYVVMEVNNVGFMINISLSCYNKIDLNKENKLYLHHIIKEDSHTLYGFLDKQERNVFRLLISVSGVGANTARMLLSAYSWGELVKIISFSDYKTLEKIKGIGVKSAQRIIIDLKDKVGVINLEEQYNNNNIGESINTNYKFKQDSILALESLGFTRKNVEQIVEDIMVNNKGISIENIVRQSLKKLTN